ncbi:IclR family transcriptional regulator [Rhizobium sp.]
MQSTAEQSASGAQSIDRAATLLLLVGRAGVGGARLSDLVEQCDLSKPTVRRMLLALERAGLLDQDEVTRRYHLGPETYVLGTLASSRFGLHPIAIRSLVRLSQLSGDTAFLSIAHDVYSICLHREEGTYPIRVHALHAGDRHPLGIGAGSLALLAALDDAAMESVLEANQQVLRERYPQFTPERLRSLVAGTRSRGYSVNPGLLLTGSWGMGAVVRGEDGRVVGAISIAAVESRLTPERQKELAPLLLKEVEWIEKRLVEVGRNHSK